MMFRGRRRPVLVLCAIAAGAVLAAIAMCSPALAQAASGGTTVDFSGFIGYVLMGLATPIVVIGSALMYRLASKMGVEVSAAQQEKLNQEAKTALKAGFMKVTDMIDERGWASADVRNETVAEAVRFFLERFPDRADKLAKQAGATNLDEKVSAVQDTLLARFPDAAREVGESPVTPPTPTPVSPPVVVNVPSAAPPPVVPPLVTS